LNFETNRKCDNFKLQSAGNLKSRQATIRKSKRREIQNSNLRKSNIENAGKCMETKTGEEKTSGNVGERKAGISKRWKSH